MRQITTSLLTNAGTVIRTLFVDAMNDVAKKMPVYYPDMAQTVQSNDLREVYGRMRGLPGYRKWIGPRVIHRMEAGDYTIFNHKEELTVSISGDDLRFDKLGLRSWMPTQQGIRARQLPDTLVWDAVNAGFASPGPDGQNFFDTDHPVTDKNGVEQSVSNYNAGTGPAWFLTTSFPGMQPIILQEVFKPNLVEKFDPTDERVFMNDEFVWGSWCMHGAGYGFWPMIQASREDLDEDGFDAAFTALADRTGDGGVKQALPVTDLWVPNKLRAAGERIVKAINKDGGGTNTNFGKCKLNVVPYLAND